MKGTRHRQRQEKKKKNGKLPKKREKHKTEGEETVARQHKTYTRIWQGIPFFFEISVSRATVEIQHLQHAGVPLL